MARVYVHEVMSSALWGRGYGRRHRDIVRFPVSCFSGVRVEP